MPMCLLLLLFVCFLILGWAICLPPAALIGLTYQNLSQHKVYLKLLQDVPVILWSSFLQEFPRKNEIDYSFVLLFIFPPEPYAVIVGTTYKSQYSLCQFPKV